MWEDRLFLSFYVLARASTGSYVPTCLGIFLQILLGSVRSGQMEPNLKVLVLSILPCHALSAHCAIQDSRGQWRNGLAEGFGKFVHADGGGCCFKLPFAAIWPVEIWQHGIAMDGNLVKKQKFAGDVYEGQWKGDKANGEGASLRLST